jgi:hypothetical protein
MKRLILLTMVLIAFESSGVFGAVGCDLNDPDRDVKRLFPESTGYKALYVAIGKKGGEPLLHEIEARLGDKFKGLYENIDVPYTMYRIYKGPEIIGYIHGVNQKGHYGGIQVFLALDLEGTIKAFYLQKLTSKGAKAFRDEAFGREFAGLGLKEFVRYDPVSGKETPPGKIAAIKNPAPDSADDFAAILRGVKKNLILIDEFLLDNAHLKYFKPAGDAKS